MTVVTFRLPFHLSLLWILIAHMGDSPFMIAVAHALEAQPVYRQPRRTVAESRK